MALVRRFLSTIAILSALLAAACATTQRSPGLTEAQKETLRAEGFVPTAEGWAFGIADKLLFPVDESEIDISQRKVIERITKALLAVGITALNVEGHTDDTGGADYNIRLSRQRADAVAEVIIATGMPRENMRIVGLGTAHPVQPNTTPEGRQENRRVVMIVSN